MRLLRDKSIWVCPAEMAGRAADGEIAYQVRVPSYYGMTAYRDRFAREYGPSPTRVELINDLVNGLDAIEPDETKRAALSEILVRARLEPVRLSLLERAEVEALQLAEERAIQACDPYRYKRARLVQHAELHVIEIVREHVIGWRNMVDGNGAELAASFEPAHDGREILSVDAVELIPEHHLAYLSKRIETLERPTGQAVKNSQSRQSGISTPKTSRTAANTPSKSRRLAASAGKSRISRTRTAKATASG